MARTDYIVEADVIHFLPMSSGISVKTIFRHFKRFITMTIYIYDVKKLGADHFFFNFEIFIQDTR